METNHTRLDDKNDEFQNFTALEIGKQSSLERNLRQFISTTLDERNLWSFPVLRDGQVKPIDITEEISNNYSEDFGFSLLSTNRLDKIDEIIRKHPQTANKRIILEWLKGKGRKPITSKTLIDVLYEIGLTTVADEVYTTCITLKIMDDPYKPSLVKDYSVSLSDKYEEESVMNSTQWLPRMFEGREVTINFVDLELKEKGSNTLLVDLIDGIISGTRILFLGRPGVGKSTIVRHLSKTLTHTEQFYLVIKIHLGMTGKIDSLFTLLDKANVNESFDSYDINVISDYVSATLGEGVCILLDGFDEYRYDSSDYVASLISGFRLKRSVIIITSRPGAAEVIQNSFQSNSLRRTVEIIGFGDSSVRTYLEQLRLSEDKYQTIYQYFDTHPIVRQLCYLPLHLSMVVYIAVITTDSNTLSLADTETELYSDFLTLTMTQYEHVRHHQMANSLIECFDDSYKQTNPNVCFILQTISENAFNGVMSRELTFNSSSFNGLANGVNMSTEIEALSFFKTETFYDRHGYRLYKYYYSHPTFQEFLAAFHLTTLPRDEQLKYTSYFWMHETYKFFLGLIGQKLNKKYDDKTVSQTFVSYATLVLATYQHQELYIMKCAHEAGKNSHFITFLQAVDVIDNSKSIDSYVNYNHECWYIGYVLAQFSLYELRVDEISELAVCISFITNYLKHYPGKVNATKLAIGNFAYGYWPWFSKGEDPVSTKEVVEFLSAFWDNLTCLELPFIRFEHSSSVIQLGETLKSFKNLQFLALSVNISIIKEGYLESILKDLPHLKHLELGVVNKHDDDTIIPGDLFEFKGLKQLLNLTICISWNKDIVDVNMTALIGGLESLTALESLTIRMILYSGFRTNGATELLRGIEKASSSNLTLELDLCWDYGMGNVTTKELAAVLKSLTVLKNLSLCVDFRFSGIQGNSGPRELVEGLKHLAKLEELSIELRWEVEENDDLDEAAIALADGLQHLNLSVLNLSLKQNGSCSKIVSLFESLTQLHELAFKCESLGEKASLFDGLKQLKELRKLGLSWNGIGDNDVALLTEALKYMKHLNTLDLSHNNIGDVGLQLLADAIDSQFPSNLQVLLLDNNNFSSSGAEILSEKVVRLFKLHIFDLGLYLGVYSAKAIAQIHRQATVVSTAMVSSLDGPRDFMVDLKFVIPSFLVAALVGGFLCHFALRSSNNKAWSYKGMSESLAQGIFSTSSAWNLESLKAGGLDGTGTVIAIFDTAVNLQLPAFLQKNYLNQITVLDFLPREIPISLTEHGNVCASVAAGHGYQYSPTTTVPSGVAPNAHLILYRVAEGDHCYNDAVLVALDDVKARTERGIKIDVVSISYDFGETYKEEMYRKIKILTENGVVVIAAAGNRGHYQAHASIPALFDNVISVGALDRNGFESKFNSCGRIDVFAPGEDIPTPSSGIIWGTSFAAPAISGLVSLLKQFANEVGPPASLHIHNVEILRSIFQTHMITRSDNNKVDIFDPVGFFLRMIDNHNLLNEIVNNHPSTSTEMEQ